MQSPKSLPLIGLVGRKGSGKSTVAEILRRVYSYSEIAFANELKLEMFHAFGRSMLSAYGRREALFSEWMAFLDGHKNDAPNTEFGWVRPMMQFWGTEYRRNLCDEDYWVSKIKHRLVPYTAVSDVRFVNEANAIREAGGVLWHVWRGEQTNQDNHASETELQKIVHHYMCWNLETIEHLEKKSIPNIFRLMSDGWSEFSE